MGEAKRRANAIAKAEVLDIETASGRARVTMLLPESLWAAVQDRAAKECTTVPKLVERVLSEYVVTDGWIVRAILLKNPQAVRVKNADPPDPSDGGAA